MQLGRLDHVFPSPRCCNSSFSCSPGSRSRTHSSSSISNAGRGKSSRHHRRPNIVLTALRNDFYLPLVKSLVCTFRISNPGIEFAVATVDGDLNSTSIQTIREELNLKIFYWSDIQFVNKKSPRFALNWVRIRAWEMEQYESILLVDADTVILGDIRHLFALPTAFATVLDQDKTSPKFSSLGRMQGGVILLRPCAAVADHMISLLDQYEYLRFTHGHAEQSFFDWS